MRAERYMERVRKKSIIIEGAGDLYKNGSLALIQKKKICLE